MGGYTPLHPAHTHTRARAPHRSVSLDLPRWQQRHARAHHSSARRRLRVGAGGDHAIAKL
jgi:hypothetical protein